MIGPTQKAQEFTTLHVPGDPLVLQPAGQVPYVAWGECNRPVDVSYRATLTTFFSSNSLMSSGRYPSSSTSMSWVFSPNSDGAADGAGR